MAGFFTGFVNTWRVLVFVLAGAFLPQQGVSVEVAGALASLRLPDRPQSLAQDADLAPVVGLVLGHARLLQDTSAVPAAHT
ncbi:MAG: hypothetical protein P8Y13_06060 [Deinococcales bacterium]